MVCHGLSPSGGLVSPSGGFASLLFDQVGYFALIKLCQALSRQGAIIKISVVRCHYLLCLGPQLTMQTVICVPILLFQCYISIVLLVVTAKTIALSI